MKQAKKDHFKARQEELEAELATEWAQRQQKETWRIAFAMANTSPGRRYKRFDAVRVQSATTREWAQHCLKEGKDGGFGGTIINYEEECEKIKQMDCAAADPDYERIPSATHLQLADTLISRLALSANKHKLGKAVVPNSVPNELYRLLLRPTWSLSITQKYGLGTSHDLAVPPLLRRTLRMLYAKILANRLAPLGWHTAYGFTVPKNSLAVGIKADRLVAAMDVWGRAFYREVIDGPIFTDKQGARVDHVTAIQEAKQRARFPVPPELVADWQFGCVPFRRREEAGLIQAVLTFFLTQLSLFVITTLHDAANAFYSPHRAAVLEACEPPFAPTSNEAYLLRQRVNYSVMVLGAGAPDETAILLGTGVIPGDHSGPRIFNRVMQYPGSTAARKFRH